MVHPRKKGSLMKQPTKKAIKEELKAKNSIIEQLIGRLQEKDLMIKEFIKKISEQ